MKKTILLPWAWLIASFLWLGCNHSKPNTAPNYTTNTKTPTNPQRYLTLGIDPLMDKALRFDLVEENGVLRLRWEANDYIQIGFQQGDGVDAISDPLYITLTERHIDDGSAILGLQIPIPDFIDTTRPYTIYGAYGPDYTLIKSVSGSTARYKLQLPNRTAMLALSSGGSLQDLKKRKLPITYFKEEIRPGTTSFTTSMKHIGSIFTLSLYTKSGANWNNYWVRLKGEETGLGADTAQPFIYNNGDPDGGTLDYFGASYDLGTLRPEPKNGKGATTLTFPQTNLVVGAKTKLYMWYPVMPNPWPLFRLELNSSVYFSNSYKSVNVKSKPSVTIVPGKVYNYYAVIEKSGLKYYINFTDRNYNILR